MRKDSCQIISRPKETEGTMREIKFRGKYKKDGVWIFGSLNPKGLEVSLATFWFTVKRGDIDIETICQYTNLNDKKNKELYARDIVEEYRVPLGCGSQEKWDELSKKVRRIAPITWSDEELSFMVNDTRLGVFNGWDNLEKIGNTFDNPELLESEDK
jgi:hypothetical protein